MKRRPGKTYRTYDSKRLTIALDPEARGGTYSPEVHIHRRGKNGSPNGFGPMRWPAWLEKMADNNPGDFALVIRIPHLTFFWAFRWRRFGALRAYRLNNRIIRRVCG